ncbi:MAG: response regulator [Actinobacteria bacterium]|nr:response regulator [Actinomycetota bacterium]
MAEATAAQPGRVLLCASRDQSILDDARYAFPADVEVRCVSDAREAWRELELLIPHAVIVDIQSGSAGGFDLARDMSQSDRLKDVPVLMLLQRTEDAWLARQGGADAILVKPVLGDELVRETLALIS